MMEQETEVVMITRCSLLLEWMKLMLVGKWIWKNMCKGDGMKMKTKNECLFKPTQKHEIQTVTDT